MSLAVVVTDRDCTLLCQRIAEELPGILIQQWPNINQPNLVEFAVLWKQPQGITNQFPNLKAVTSLGAGTDHMDNDVALVNVPQHRIVVEGLKQLMAQYVLLHVLSESRQQLPYYLNQHIKRWQVMEEENPSPVIGFLGLGELGKFVANRCIELGFQTQAWTVQSEHSKHKCFHGKAGLQHVISNSDFIVVLLPLTEQTHHIINDNSLTWFKSDAVLINVARGGHVDESALIEALKNKQLKHAVLDVFETEPLPQDSELWSLENVTITPHVSARSDVNQTTEAVVSLFNSYILSDSKA